jgi:hemerythrin
MSITWEESLRLGVPAIDEQHEEIFVYFDKLSTALREEDGSNVIIELLSYLDNYSSLHFRNEEELMALYRYPGLEEQQRQHAAFRENIVMFTDMLSASEPTHEIALKIDALLIRYFINHVRKLDREIADYIKLLPATNS